MQKFCALADTDFSEGIACAHKGIAKVNHWSCCGSTAQFGGDACRLQLAEPHAHALAPTPDDELDTAHVCVLCRRATAGRMLVCRTCDHYECLPCALQRGDKTPAIAVLRVSIEDELADAARKSSALTDSFLKAIGGGVADVRALLPTAHAAVVPSLTIAALQTQLEEKGKIVALGGRSIPTGSPAPLSAPTLTSASVRGAVVANAPTPAAASVRALVDAPAPTPASSSARIVFDAPAPAPATSTEAASSVILPAVSSRSIAVLKSEPATAAVPDHVVAPPPAPSTRSLETVAVATEPVAADVAAVPATPSLRAIGSRLPTKLVVPPPLNMPQIGLTAKLGKGLFAAFKMSHRKGEATPAIDDGAVASETTSAVAEPAAMLDEGAASASAPSTTAVAGDEPKMEVVEQAAVPAAASDEGPAVSAPLTTPVAGDEPKIDEAAVAIASSTPSVDAPAEATAKVETAASAT